VPAAVVKVPVQPTEYSPPEMAIAAAESKPVGVSTFDWTGVEAVMPDCDAKANAAGVVSEARILRTEPLVTTSERTRGLVPCHQAHLVQPRRRRWSAVSARG
jgi:hypothetical protein